MLNNAVSCNLERRALPLVFAAACLVWVLLFACCASDIAGGAAAADVSWRDHATVSPRFALRRVGFEAPSAKSRKLIRVRCTPLYALTRASLRRARCFGSGADELDLRWGRAELHGDAKRPLPLHTSGAHVVVRCRGAFSPALHLRFMISLTRAVILGRKRTLCCKKQARRNCL